MLVDRVLVDANCLHKLYLRNLLLTLADCELIELRWSQEIIVETIRSLVKRFPNKSASVTYRLNSLNHHFRESLVIDYEYLVGKLGCRDKADEHVLAAAIHSQSKYLLTFNVSDFPKEAQVTYGVEIVDPDIFLLMLADRDEQAFLAACAVWLAHFKLPEFNALEAAKAIRLAGCEAFSEWLSERAELLDRLL